MMHRKTIALLALLTALSLALCSCAILETITSPAQQPTVNVEPTPEPTPEPEGIEKVFGKETTVAVTGCGGEETPFYIGARRQLELLGIGIAPADDAAAANAADAAIAYMPDETLASAISVPSVLYTDEVLTGTLISIDAQAPVGMLTDAVLGYEAHEAPVRTILLANSEDSPLYSAVAGGDGLGRFQLKGVYAGAADGAASALGEGLSNTLIGLLDTVVVEDPEVAVEAFRKLQSAARSDTTEVMTLGITDAVIEAMREEHFLMGAAVGYNEYAAGAMAARMAVLRLLGEDVESCALEPVLLTSDDVLALSVQEGDALDGEKLMFALAEEPVTEFGNETLDYLCSYYGAAE